MNIKKCLSGCLKLVPMRHSEPAKQVKNLNAMKNKILRLSLRMTDKLSDSLKLVPMRHSEPAKQVKNLNAMKNKILRLSLRMTDKCSGCLKNLRLLMILCLFAHTAYAQNDIAKTENYLPNGKYRLFGSGRGEVQNIDNQIHRHGQLTQQAGNLSIETRLYQGDLSYQQHFHHHGHSVHAPFENKAQRNFSAKTGSVVQGGATLTDLSVTGYEIHPADAYDGEQGGGYPVPTGARDEYLYKVQGKEVSVKVVALDKLPPKTTDDLLLRKIGINPERYHQAQQTDNSSNKKRKITYSYVSAAPHKTIVTPSSSTRTTDPYGNTITTGNWGSGSTILDFNGADFDFRKGGVVGAARNPTIVTPSPYSMNSHFDGLLFRDDPVSKGSGGNGGGNGGSGGNGDKQNDDNDPPVLGYYYEDEDNESLKLGYYDDELWEDENTWGLTTFYPNNNCYTDCVIDLNNPTQWYGWQLMPTRGAYAPSEQVVAAEFFVNINNFEAALITGALTLPPVIEQGIRNALESGDSKKAKNIYNQYAQSQAAGGAMPPNGDNDKNGIKEKNDYTNKQKQKANSAETGDKIRTPDSHPNDFQKLRGNQGYQNKYTGEIWQRSDTQHMGKQGEWKVGIGKNPPQKGSKITVDAQTGKVLKK